MSAFPKPWITDPPIEHLRSGWAKLPFQGSRGHYWTEDTNPPAELPVMAEGGRVRWYTSLCGLGGMTRPRAPAMGVGSWPYCRKCEKRHIEGSPPT